MNGLDSLLNTKTKLLIGANLRNLINAPEFHLVIEVLEVQEKFK